MSFVKDADFMTKSFIKIKKKKIFKFLFILSSVLVIFRSKKKLKSVVDLVYVLPTQKYGIKKKSLLSYVIQASRRIITIFNQNIFRIFILLNVK